MKEKVYFLAQIVSAMEEAVVKLEEAYNEKNAEDFKKARKTILEFQKNLSGELEGKR